jgi:membrane-associated phospholipid phosphatase
VALVVRRTTRNSWARGLAWLHAIITAVVVIGTGNHWILDVAAGWAVVIVAMWLVDPWFDDKRELVKSRRVEFHERIAGTAVLQASPEVTADEAPLTTEALEAWADPSRKRRYDC